MVRAPHDELLEAVNRHRRSAMRALDEDIAQAKRQLAATKRRMFWSGVQAVFWIVLLAVLAYVAVVGEVDRVERLEAAQPATEERPS